VQPWHHLQSEVARQTDSIRLQQSGRPVASRFRFCRRQAAGRFAAWLASRRKCLAAQAAKVAVLFVKLLKNKQ
jgi:hypothetical protein